jgi:hypothetical protein
MEKNRKRKVENWVVSGSCSGCISILGEGMAMDKFLSNIGVISCTVNNGWCLKWCVMKGIMPHLRNGTFVRARGKSQTVTNFNETTDSWDLIAGTEISYLIASISQNSHQSSSYPIFTSLDNFQTLPGGSGVFRIFLELGNSPAELF